MPRSSPYTILLAPGERARLESWARKYTSPYYQVIRAKIVLLAAEGRSNKEIAHHLDVPRQIVSKWRKRFHQQRLAGLEDRPRTGRPSGFPPQVVVQVKALACQLPSESGIPLSRFSTADIAAEIVHRGIVAQISGSTVWRWLHEDALRPWYHRSWIFPRDPEFETKANRVLDLYHRTWDGGALGPDEFVLCADEKTSIQARVRVHPSQPPLPGKPGRVEHEYERGGALAYLAAWDVHHARLFGRCEPKTGIEPFDQLVSEIMALSPYNTARRVFLVVDNGSAHRGLASVQRLQTAWPNLQLIHLPVHASWLNQIEIYFSIVQRKVLTPNDFESIFELEDRLLAFQQRYQDLSAPFEWKFSRNDLRQLMRRLKNDSVAMKTAA